MQYVILLLRDEHNNIEMPSPCYLKSFDPKAYEGRGYLTTTQDSALAERYTKEQAFTVWQNGLRAYSVLIESLDESTQNILPGNKLVNNVRTSGLGVTAMADNLLRYAEELRTITEILSSFGADKLSDKMKVVIDNLRKDAEEIYDTIRFYKSS